MILGASKRGLRLPMDLRSQSSSLGHGPKGATLEIHEVRKRVHYLLAHARGVNGIVEHSALLEIACELHNYHPFLSGYAEDEARACIRETIRIMRYLSAQGIAEAIPFLLHALESMGEALKYPTKGAAGLTQTEELVAVWRELASIGASPVAQSNLANSLNTLAIRLLDSGRPEEALRVGAESLEAWHHVDTGLPTEVRFQRLVAIRNQLMRLVDLHHHEGLEDLRVEALRFSEELLTAKFADPGMRDFTRQVRNEVRSMQASK